MRIALIGGMFDPPHVGHLILAEETRDILEADKVIFIPTADHPFKVQAQYSNSKHRLAMLQLAIQDNSAFNLSEIELDRTGVSYSVNTIEAIRNQHPDTELYFCIGADNAASFSNWHNPKRITELCNIVVWGRDSIDFTNDPFSGSMRKIDTTIVDISSTQIRERVRNRQSIRYLVSNAVEDYIIDMQLYTNA